MVTPDNSKAIHNNKAMRARHLRSRLQQIETWPQYAHYRELLKHKQELKAWYNVDVAIHYKKFLGDAIITFSDQLINNFMDAKGHDLSAVIRGRLYQLKEVVGIVEELDSYDKMKTELLVLENEGFKATPEEGYLT